GGAPPRRTGRVDGPRRSRRGRRSYVLPVPRECPGFLLRRLPRPPVGGAPPRRTGRVDGPRRFAAGAPLLRPPRAPRVPGVSPATPAPTSRRRRAPAPNREGGWDRSRRGRRSYVLPVPRQYPGFLLRHLPRPPVGGAPPRRTGRVDGPGVRGGGAAPTASPWPGSVRGFSCDACP